MSKFRRFFVSVVLGASMSLVAHAGSTTYQLDPNHTDIIITWNHLGYSHPSAMFNHITGTLVYDPADPAKASVKASIPVASVHTAAPALDEHLQGDDFFNVAKYPTMTFKSTRVTAGAVDGQLRVTGNLTVHGVTRPVTLDVTVNKVGTRQRHATVAFNASATLKRSDFGVDLYVPLVSDEVKLSLTTEAVAATVADVTPPAQAAQAP